MAKLSLSWALNRRKRIRIVTGLAVLLLLFFGISMMISKNPKGTKAASLSGSSYIIDDNYYCPAVYAASTWSCIGGGAPSDHLVPTDDLTFNGGGASAYKFVMRGTNTFRNLTIMNGAVVTHEALTVNANSVPATSTDFDTTSSALTAVGSAKKVDLIVTNTLTLNNGKIDVDGKGYPGGIFNLNNLPTPGYGPGQSSRTQSNTVYSASGGAGFKGKGGNGSVSPPDVNYSIGGGTYSQSTPLKHGSGAGAAAAIYLGTYECHVAGGSGGGVVKIKATQIQYLDTASYISANGTSSGSGVGTANCKASAGGGSGGSVWIDVGSINYTTLVGMTAANVGNDNLSAYGNAPSPSSDINGAIAAIGYDISALYNIYSKGGSVAMVSGGVAGFAIGGLGGGGDIVVNKIVDQPVTIKKILVPIQRYFEASDSVCNPIVPGSNRNCFNPYALQKGDKIRVVFEVTNLLPGNLHMEDEVLTVPYTNPDAYCEPTPAAGLFDDGELVEGSDITDAEPMQSYYNSAAVPKILSWDYIVPSTETTHYFSYTCTVL